MCHSIDEFVQNLRARTMPLRQSVDWLATEQRAMQKDPAKNQVVVIGLPKTMKPENGHRFISTLLPHVQEIRNYLFEVKVANADEDLEDSPDMALQLLSIRQSTQTIGQTVFSDITILTFKEH